MNWLDKIYIAGIKALDPSAPKFPVGSEVETLVDERAVPAGSKCRVMDVFPGGYKLLWRKEIIKNGMLQGFAHHTIYLGEHCLKKWEG